MTSVTVVVPCYRYGHYLNDAVASVLTQQPGIQGEVIIVDDCSPDVTEKIGLALAREDRRVRYVRHERNLGHIETYNHGLQLAQGEYVALLSADDLVAAGALTRAVRALEDNPSAAFAYGPVAVAWQESPGLSNSTYASAYDDYQITVKSGRDWSAEIVRRAHNVIHSPEVLVRTSSQVAAGGYRLELPHAGDLEMWLRLATLGDVVRLSGPKQAIRRMHKSNMSHAFPALSVADLSQLLTAFEYFDRQASTAWEDYASCLPQVRAKIAKRALNQAAKGFRSEIHPDDRQLQLLRFSAQTHPSIERHLLYHVTSSAVAGNRGAAGLLRAGLAAKTRWEMTGSAAFRPTRE